MIDVTKLRRKDQPVLVFTPDRKGTEVKILRAPKFLVHYPKTPGSAMQPQETALTLKEAEGIWSRVQRERPDLKPMDVKISTIDGTFV